MHKVSTDQVKQALVRIAKQKNGDTFGLFVIREVVHAIHNNLHHNLKMQVLQEIFLHQQNFNQKDESENSELEFPYQSIDDPENISRHQNKCSEKQKDLFNGNAIQKKITDQDRNELLDKLKKIRSYYGGQKLIVNMTGLSERVFTLLLQNKTKLTNRTYNIINQYVDEALDILMKRSLREAKEVQHNYLSYKNGCRCEICKAAWRKYISENKLKKQSQQIII